MIRIWILIGFLVSTLSLAAQEISLGVIGGARISELDLAQSIMIDVNGEAFAINTDELAYNPTLGAFVKLKVGGVFLQPEIHYATSTAFVEANNGTDAYLHKLTVQRIDIPMQMGLEFFKAVRLYGGLNASLIQADNWYYDDPFWSSLRLRNQETSWSTIVGAGLSIGRITVDARYERQLGTLFVDSAINGVNYQFKGQRSAYVALVGFMLFK